MEVGGVLEWHQGTVQHQLTQACMERAESFSLQHSLSPCFRGNNCRLNPLTGDTELKFWEG